MAGSTTVLVVDDDPHILDVVRFALTKAGFRVETAGDGREALERFAVLGPDLVVLDIMMPELDGSEVCRQIRARSRIPIIFLSSRDDEIDRIVGLELGGDDYMTKPFSPRELVARIRAVLRRTQPPTTPEPIESASDSPKARLLEHGKLCLDLDRFQASWNGEEVQLTVTEFGLLRTMMGFPGKVFTRDELMDGAYAYQNIVTDRTIDSHIRRVRRKFGALGGEPIATVHGVGYRLGDCR